MALFDSQPSRKEGAAARGASRSAPRRSRAGRLDCHGKEDFDRFGTRPYLRVLCTEMWKARESLRDANTLYIALPAKARRRSWSATGIHWACAARCSARYYSQGSIRDGGCGTEPRRRSLFQGGDCVAAMFLDVSHTYVGLLEQGRGLRCHGDGNARRGGCRASHGEAPDVIPTSKSRFMVGKTADKARADQVDWFQAITEAVPIQPRKQVLRASRRNIPRWKRKRESRLWRSAPAAVRHAEILPMERIYRDTGLRSLMLPWTAELCLDRIGRERCTRPAESTPSPKLPFPSSSNATGHSAAQPATIFRGRNYEYGA